MLALTLQIARFGLLSLPSLTMSAHYHKSCLAREEPNFCHHFMTVFLLQQIPLFRIGLYPSSISIEKQLIRSHRPFQSNSCCGIRVCLCSSIVTCRLTRLGICITRLIILARRGCHRGCMNTIVDASHSFKEITFMQMLSSVRV